MALIMMNLFVDFLFVSSRFLQQLSARLPYFAAFAVSLFLGVWGVRHVGNFFRDVGG